MNREGVALVIPARNASERIEEVLDAVLPLRDRGQLEEIVVVDDASTDDTAAVVSRHPVRLLQGPGGGPGAARNRGWRASSQPLVWFIDADCVAEPGALKRLVDELADPTVAGVGGGYANHVPESLLGSIIHEEMEARNEAETCDASFLRGSNVVFRRRVLEELGGFDECHYNGPGSPGAEDMEIGYRAIERGHRLRFVPDSRVGHYHPTRLRGYLRSQRHHGYWRVWLYARHPGWMGGDSYTGLLDHLQPPLALVTLASLPLLGVPGVRGVAMALLALLMAAQIPMARALVERAGDPRYWVFVPMGALRAVARSLGMAVGSLSVLRWRAAGRSRLSL